MKSQRRERHIRSHSERHGGRVRHRGASVNLNDVGQIDASPAGRYQNIPGYRVVPLRHEASASDRHGSPDERVDESAGAGSGNSDVIENPGDHASTSCRRRNAVLDETTEQAEQQEE